MDLLTFGMLAGCILCYTFQGLFGKMYASAYEGNESDATPVYSTLYGVIVGVTLFYAVLSAASVILGDLLLGAVDPRISFKR